MALNTPPITWLAYEGPEFRLVLRRNVRGIEAAEEGRKRPCA